MTVLNIIFTIMAIAANAALAFLAGYAFVAMRRLQRDVEGMRHSGMMTFTLTMASHVKENFEELNRMKEEFNRLVEAEQYEEAQRLQGVIEKAAHAAKFCRPLIDPDGGIHMSESWLCPTVAHVSDGVEVAFRKMQASRPCKGCRLYRNFERLHVEMKVLEKTEN